MKVSNLEITLSDGLPITVAAYICPAEYDVGIMADYVEDWEITHVMGRKCKKQPKSIYGRLTTKDIDKLEDDILGAIDVIYLD